ncbi:ABC transporter permease [Leucothrix mucor]|uniref:ABC transporter permease n=1 Tax=Leucothrix mucor TaxID=45248 RepID=UPI0003B44B23|nr:ABC transporter permease [Leucothrix mucor]
MTELTQLAQPSLKLKQRSSLPQTLLRLAITVAVLLGVWQGLILLFDLQPFILPTPLAVLERLILRYDVLLYHGWVTGQEIILGIVLGLSLGLMFALQMLLFKPVKRWLLPVLIASQAVPVFAIAPVLMLWLDYGMASKVAMAAIIIFFPVTTCCYDGLRNTPRGFLDLAQTMQASRWQRLRHIQLPAALPALASGIRVAVVVAPIGAVAGEWVGSSEGLGYLMLQANARMMIDEMFAALFLLSMLSVVLYFMTDYLLKKLIPWDL